VDVEDDTRAEDDHRNRLQQLRFALPDAAAAAHCEHEKRIGEADPNWPDWYAEYMVSEQTGAEPPK